MAVRGDRGSAHAAVMLTLIRTAKLNDVDPQGVLAWIADHKITDHGGADLLSKDQQTIAFALAEMEYLRELIAEHKRNIPAVLSGRLAEGRYGRRLHTGRQWRNQRRYFPKRNQIQPSTRDEKPSPDNAVDDTHVPVLAGISRCDDWRNYHQEGRWRELRRYRRYQLDGGATSRRYR